MLGEEGGRWVCPKRPEESRTVRRYRLKTACLGNSGSSPPPPACEDCCLLTFSFCLQDCFFYSLVFDPVQKTLLADQGEIRVGCKYQAEIPDRLAEGKQQDRLYGYWVIEHGSVCEWCAVELYAAQSSWLCAATLMGWDPGNLRGANGHSWEEKSES